MSIAKTIPNAGPVVEPSPPVGVPNSEKYWTIFQIADLLSNTHSFRI
jgi:hypothetical protein